MRPFDDKLFNSLFARATPSPDIVKIKVERSPAPERKAPTFTATFKTPADTVPEAQKEPIKQGVGMLLFIDYSYSFL